MGHIKSFKNFNTKSDVFTYLKSLNDDFINERIESFEKDLSDESLQDNLYAYIDDIYVRLSELNIDKSKIDDICNMLDKIIC